MALKKILTGSDDFKDVGAPLNLSAHTTDDGDSWVDVGGVVSNRLVIPSIGSTTGTVQCSVGGNQSELAGARIEVDPARIPAGVVLDKPRYLISARGVASLLNTIERVLVGIYATGSNSLFVGGYLSGGASIDCGDTRYLGYHPVLGVVEMGGKFSFAHRIACLNEFVGGSGGDFQEFGSSTQNRFTLYVDEYQMTFRYSVGTAMADQVFGYTLYPKVLRTLRLPPDASASFQISPFIGIRQSDISATNGGRLNSLNWAYLDFTPQEISPPWEPLEDFFIAKVALDFQSVLDCADAPCAGIATPASNGPYLIRAPAQFTDVDIVRAAMAFVDNSYNGAFLTMQIGNLKYEIPPFTRFQLVMPTNYVAILINGGGWNATLTLTSKIIEYAYF